MVRVVVPATSANLGPGFDALGIALDLYNEFTFEEIDSGLEIIGCEKEYQNKDNLIYTSMLKTFEKVDYLPRGMKISIKSEIPVSRGLGSSASCILAGVIGANKLSGSRLGEEELFKLATEIEGHPDNIAPALFGGLVTSIMREGEIHYNHIEVAKGLKLLALIPDFTLSTLESRGVLPEEIAYEDGVFNVGRISLMISALVNGRFDLLKYGLEDRIHQQYRGRLINDYDLIMDKCRTIKSYGSYLSGAGPTIMVVLDEDDEDFALEIGDFLAGLEDDWMVRELKIETRGARILE